MNIKEAYNKWSEQYDTNENKTRDLEALALIETVADYTFQNCLEVGCGTGKNTGFLLTRANHITAIDLSAEMLAKAKQKIQSDKVDFQQFDIMNEWNFTNKKFDLVTFSLILEHIENLDAIFEKVVKIIAPGGLIYIGELHPFKQYAGSKARFETDEGLQVVTCYNHNVSEFINAAKKNVFYLETIHEYFDDRDKVNIPRVLAMLFKYNQ